MFLIILGALAAFGGITGSKPKEHYCNISEQHTMCQYTRFNSMNLRCRNYRASPASDVKIILKNHNTLRNIYAGGGPDVSNVPNMLGLVWDTELAEIAARWAQQCPYYEDEFRDVERFKVANLVELKSDNASYPTLEDVWMSTTSGNRTFHTAIDEYALTDRFSWDDPLTLITNPYFKYVGCAAASYRQFLEEDEELYVTLLVCNYGPLDFPYSKDQPHGPPCSNCPSATSCSHSSTFIHLCFDRLEIHKHWKEKLRALAKARISSDQPSGADVPRKRHQSANISYCNIVCQNGHNHTMCKYKGPTEKYDVIPVMGNSGKDTVLSFINSLRSEFAAGEHSLGYFPLAANMREMWSQELADIAQRWTEQCIPEKYDKCRSIFLKDGDPEPTHISQTIDHGVWDEHTPFPSFTETFIKWMEGVDFFTRSVIQPYRRPKKYILIFYWLQRTNDYSNFAQLIWAESYLLGCSVTLCRSFANESIAKVVTACNYGPGGQQEGHSVYVPGGPCTACKRVSTSEHGGLYCSLDYPNLCSRALVAMSCLTGIGLPLFIVFLSN